MRFWRRLLQPHAATSPRERRLRALWLLVWIVMLFAPSVLIGLSAAQSKFSLASFLAAAFVAWRIVFRPFPSLKGALLWGFLLALYLLIHGVVLTLSTGSPVILLLEGQWLAYFVAGLLLTADLIAARADIQWIDSALVALGVIASVLGIVSIWTGPFYGYANHFEGRWGIPISRACGTFEAPAMLAGFLTITFVLSFFTAPTSGGSFLRQAGLFLMMVTLLLTQSKAGIVVAILAVVLGLPIVARTAAKRRAALARLAYIGIFVAAIAYFADAYGIDAQALLASDVHDRGELGSAVLTDYADDGPTAQLFGVGYRQSATIDPETGMWFTAHNSYISFLREIGLIGCVLLAGYLLWTMGSLIAAGNHNLALAVLAILLVAYTEVFLYGSYSAFFLGCAGAAAARASALSKATAPALLPELA
jgi:hypothetical protein